MLLVAIVLVGDVREHRDPLFNVALDHVTSVEECFAALSLYSLPLPVSVMTFNEEPTLAYCTSLCTYSADNIERESDWFGIIDSCD